MDTKGREEAYVLMKCLDVYNRVRVVVSMSLHKPFDPCCLSASGPFFGRLEFDLVQEASSLRNKRPSDLDGGDVGKDCHKVLGAQLGLPTKLRILVKSELVILHLSRINKTCWC